MSINKLSHLKEGEKIYLEVTIDGKEYIATLKLI